MKETRENKDRLKHLNKKNYKTKENDRDYEDRNDKRFGEKKKRTHKNLTHYYNTYGYDVDDDED